MAMAPTLPILTSTNGLHSYIFVHDLLHPIDEDLTHSEVTSVEIPGIEERLRANLVQDGQVLLDFPCLLRSGGGAASCNPLDFGDSVNAPS
jgi:hypothetical protein